MTIVEYTDFEDPFCAEAQPTVERILAEFPSQVRLLFRQNPQPEHPHAQDAAAAALCAHDQSRYWDYRKALFSDQKALDHDRLLGYAHKLGLDEPRFSRCLQSGEKAGIVRRDIEEARTNGLEGSPVFSVNGARLSGAHSFQTFHRLIRFDVPEG